MDKLNKWFAETLRKELDAGKSLYEIRIKFKPLNDNETSSCQIGN